MPAAVRPPNQALRLQPLPAAPYGVWRLPGSKSLTNRALVLAALAAGRSRLQGTLASDDTHHMRACLAALGIAIQDAAADELFVDGGRQLLREAAAPLFVGNSGTTVRFLTALSCLVPGTVALYGDEHMAKRPIADLTEALTQLGVECHCASGCPPLHIVGGRLPGGRIRMQGHRSSQYFTALIMAGSQAEAPLRIDIEGNLVSRPYVQMTISMLRAFGGEAALHTDHILIEPRRLQACRYQIEPDASAASYAFALAAAGGGTITVPGLGRDALQGDVGFVDVLAQMGAEVEVGADGITVTGPAAGLRGIDVDMEHISDTVMSLAAVAPLATGPTTIRNIGNIRIKETDRLQALVTELRRLGQEVDSGEDWLRITPRPLQAAAINCYSDHRMAMSFAILGALRPGITITDPACVAKTYPGFWDDLARIYRTQSASGW